MGNGGGGCDRVLVEGSANAGDEDVSVRVERALVYLDIWMLA